MTSMVTWQAEDEVGLEGVRVLIGATGFRALGRVVRTGPGQECSASYRLDVHEDGTVARLSVTATTADRERHLTINRNDDGYWLLDDGGAGPASRRDLGDTVDVDLERSPLFQTLPIRRLGLHTQAGEHVVPVLFVSLPGLEVELVDQHYRTVSTLDDAGTAVVNVTVGDVSADLTVDADGIVSDFPGLARRVHAAEPVG